MFNNYVSIFKFAQRLQESKSRTAGVWLLFSSVPSLASPDHYCHLCVGLALQILAFNNTLGSKA